MSDIENTVFCGNCAKRVAPAMFCSSCGAVLITNEPVEEAAPKAAAPKTATPKAQAPAVTEEKPVLIANAETPVSTSPPMNTFAIVALVLSIFGFGFVASIMGHISLSQIKQRGEDGRGLAIAAIVIGYLTTFLIFVGIAIIWAWAVSWSNNYY